MRTHLVTGSTSGMGAVVTRRLAERGDRLVLLARDESRATWLREEFADAQVLVADLADPGTLNGIGRQVDGPLDSVLHSAGAVQLGPVSRLRLHDWEQQLAVNLTSPAVLTRELLPHLRAARGLIVFVNSGSGLRANPEWSAYAASKFGLRALADALRAEEAEHGVRVSSVYPGRTATRMQQRVHEQEDREYDASLFIDVETAADTILHVLDLPGDAIIPDISIRPAPRPC